MSPLFHVRMLQSSAPTEEGRAKARCMRLDATTFVCGISLKDVGGSSSSSTRFHFVLDNSSSMVRQDTLFLLGARSDNTVVSND
jgi:hypothetical protein